MADYRAYLIDRNDRVILRKDMSRRTTKPRWKPPGFMPMASTSRYGITPAKWDESAKSKSQCRVPYMRVSTSSKLSRSIKQLRQNSRNQNL
jgi:hypothetical protein